MLHVENLTVAYGDLTRDEQRHIDTYFRDILTEMIRKNQAEE